MMLIDYYETLELSRNATDADIKRAYQFLALKYHPQIAGETDSVKFNLLGEAYDVLGDSRKKATYDKFGLEGLKDGIPLELDENGTWTWSKYTYHRNPEKTFRQFFGSNNPFAVYHAADTLYQCRVLKTEEVKTQDSHIEKDLHLSLDDLYHGCIKKIRISRRVMNEDGHTTSNKAKTLTIIVRPGWKDGAKITFPQEGDQGPNNIPADFVFIVRQKSHPMFIRQNNDLIYNAHISLEKALTGFSVDVETLDGRKLHIPINDVVHPKYKKVMTGEGMPLSQDPSQKGNLIIHFEVEFPCKLSNEKKNLIKNALSK